MQLLPAVLTPWVSSTLEHLRGNLAHECATAKTCFILQPVAPTLLQYGRQVPRVIAPIRQDYVCCCPPAVIGRHTHRCIYNAIVTCAVHTSEHSLQVAYGELPTSSSKLKGLYLSRSNIKPAVSLHSFVCKWSTIKLSVGRAPPKTQTGRSGPPKLHCTIRVDVVCDWYLLGCLLIATRSP